MVGCCFRSRITAIIIITTVHRVYVQCSKCEIISIIIFCIWLIVSDDVIQLLHNLLLNSHHWYIQTISVIPLRNSANWAESEYFVLILHILGSKAMSVANLNLMPLHWWKYFMVWNIQNFEIENSCWNIKYRLKSYQIQKQQPKLKLLENKIAHENHHLNRCSASSTYCNCLCWQYWGCPTSPRSSWGRPWPGPPPPPGPGNHQGPDTGSRRSRPASPSTLSWPSSSSPSSPRCSPTTSLTMTWLMLTCHILQLNWSTTTITI